MNGQCRTLRGYSDASLTKLVALSAFLFAATGCRAPTHAASSAKGLLAHPHADLAALKSRLPSLMDSAGIPGMSAAIISDGRILWAGGFGIRGDQSGGVVDANTVFEAASLSKPVIAYAALRLMDQGRLELDRPLATYLPLVGVPDARARAITARHVMSHTTGLQNERIGSDTLAFAFTPGEKFRYSGEGYIYLGGVVATIMGTSLDDAIRSLVFEPLGMQNSGFVWHSRFDSNAAIGHGGYREQRTPGRPTVPRGSSTLHTTARDYAQFLLAAMTGKGLRPGTSAVVLTPQVEVAPGVSWGLGWSIERSDAGSVIWHHGDNSSSGFTAFAMADPKTKNGFVYFANSTTGLGIIHEMLNLLEGAHVAADGLNYERYNSPTRLVRLAVEREARQHGGARALELYSRMRQTHPASAFPEDLLNSLGYRLLQLGRAKDAVILFQRNAQEFPTSANVFDSLGDGLAAAGDREGAIKAYGQSLTLDPANTHARDMIQQLKRARD